jgi:hypothetical protein
MRRQGEDEQPPLAVPAGQAPQPGVREGLGESVSVAVTAPARP